jgi:diaminohydroxyphosphoribosylaminopyrimidine deaminase / 5-amino-6-(5-phosphoribosylamino)uracil reductase
VTEAAADLRYMRRALELAALARGLTSPNPMVGAVVVAGDRIVGEGFHRRAGAPHAEVEALANAGAAAGGATLYVALEPCNHHGRTAPCVPVVIASGVARVVSAIADPNPFVGGGGNAALHAAGIQVVTGVLRGEAAALNRVFLTAMRERRPHVLLKAGVTLDGKIADLHGTSRWISGEVSRRQAHRLRSEVDAIVIGVGTLLRDDPALTVRLDAPWPREPYRVVLDAAARTPTTARAIGAATPARTLIAVAEDAPAGRVAALESAGATVVRCRTSEGRIDPAAILGALFQREVRGVMLEGGGEVHASFLAAGVVDRVALFLAPCLLGGRLAPSLVGGEGFDLKSAVRLGPLEVSRQGDDLLVEADVLRASNEAA